jgi:hypothetical protein
MPSLARVRPTGRRWPALEIHGLWICSDESGVPIKFSQAKLTSPAMREASRIAISKK